jgi:Skp family chaperone for outer membrane proteins
MKSRVFISRTIARKALQLCAGIALLLVTGCAGSGPLMSPILKRSDPSSDNIKDYQSLTITKPEPVNSGVRLVAGDAFTLLPRETRTRETLRYKIGDEPAVAGGKYHHIAGSSGSLYLSVEPSQQVKSFKPMDLEIIVWKRADWLQIAAFFETMKKDHPNSLSVAVAYHEANLRYEADAASRKASERIDEARKQWEEEKEKTAVLSKQLEDKEKRERALMGKLAEGAKVPPVILVVSPKEGWETESNVVSLSGVIQDDQGLEALEISINDEKLKTYWIGVDPSSGQETSRRLEFQERIPLRKGENRIKINAVDVEGFFAEKIISVRSVEKKRNVWAVVIGVNSYPNVRPLKYAVNDAMAFCNHLVEYNQVPKENVVLLLDEEANLTRLRSALGVYLKNKASKDDMVIIYFAGHGATERDSTSPDGDGLEKYLLPYDVDPKELYATALPMEEISRLFSRIRSDRLVFIVDTCYSGASGGRTISVADIRAGISDGFLDRITGGKGKIILTASGANEVSAESDELQHGIFTHFLIKGLQGQADSDGDGLITVDEVYTYVSKQVPQATNQEQHPVKKGIVEGPLILSIVR